MLQILDVEILDDGLRGVEVAGVCFLDRVIFAALFVAPFLLCCTFLALCLSWVDLQLLQAVQKRRITYHPALSADSWNRRSSRQGRQYTSEAEAYSLPERCVLTTKKARYNMLVGIITVMFLDPYCTIRKASAYVPIQVVCITLTGHTVAGNPTKRTRDLVCRRL